jgi:glutamate racemase
MRVIVFDSGVGGLSIAAKLSEYPLSYVLDHAFFPYGEKTEQEIRQRVLEVFAQVLSTYDNTSALIIVACNTVSTLCMQILRDKYPQHSFIGVVPAIKPAALISKSKCISVVATRRTVESNYLDKLAADHAVGVRVQKIAAPDWVMLAEELVYGQTQKADERIEAILGQLDPMSDVLVLGCTHFSHLRDYIEKKRKDLCVMDSVEAILNRFHTLYKLDSQTKGKEAILYSPTKAINLFFTSAGYSVQKN